MSSTPCSSARELAYAFAVDHRSRWHRGCIRHVVEPAREVTMHNGRETRDDLSLWPSVLDMVVKAGLLVLFIVGVALGFETHHPWLRAVCGGAGSLAFVGLLLLVVRPLDGAMLRAMAEPATSALDRCGSSGGPGRGRTLDGDSQSAKTRT
jgi:hypothetical protein